MKIETKIEEKEKKREKRHRRNEGILIGLVLLAAAGYLLWRQGSQSGTGKTGEVVVQADGKEYARLPLDEDAELDIVQGERHNYLLIQDGVATVTEATCPDKQCVHQADISRNGEMIVCLPNKVLITIEHGEDAGLDGAVK